MRHNRGFLVTVIVIIFAIAAFGIIRLQGATLPTLPENATEKTDLQNADTTLSAYWNKYFSIAAPIGNFLWNAFKANMTHIQNGEPTDIQNNWSSTISGEKPNYEKQGISIHNQVTSQNSLGN